jgi:tRNA 2-thiouridine synthesizing protein A
MKREKLDARGKTCPWPIILTKEKLNKMKSGDILEVTVDYQPSKENVVRFANSNGNKVLDVVNENKQIMIIIEKK